MLFLLLGAFCHTLSQTYHISGNVSTSKEAVINAEVTFINAEDSTKKFTTLTDNLGNYQLNLITSVNNQEVTIPTNFELAQNYPNPFSNETAITYKLNEQADISIKIYNVLGQEVKKIAFGTQQIGVHGITWDGRDNYGNKVTPGIYFYQLQNRNEKLMKKMVYGIGSPVGVQLNINRVNVGNEGIKNLHKDLVETGSYTVKIRSTADTKPIIKASEFPNITVKRDTTLNFQVQEAEQWKLLGLEDETVTAIAVDPIDPKIIYSGTLYDYSAGKSGKLFKSTDAGTTWDTLVIGGGYRNILIDPSNHNIMYASPGGIIKSEDGGKTWKQIMDGIYLDPETRVQSLAMNPKNPNVLYAGTGGFFGGNFYKSYDGGLHWNKTSSDSLRDGVVSIAVDPIDTNNVYAGTAFRGILWKSTDAGVTWFRTGLGEIGVHNIFVDPQMPTKIYVGIPWLGIFRTEDGGMSWENFSQGLPAERSVMKILKSNVSRLFLVATSGDDGGIYEYSFLQNQWIRIGINALHVSYYYSDLKISSDHEKLYFGGKGIYVMSLK